MGELKFDSNSCMDGLGTLFVIEEKLVYEGSFVEGKRSNYGRAIFLNGDVYEG